MSVIKEIYDITKDITKNKNAQKKIKKAILLEAKANLKFLQDLSNPKSEIKEERLIQIINNIEIDELKALIKNDIPYKSITNKKVTKKIVGGLAARRTIRYDLETLLERIYLMVTYIKKDYKKEKLRLGVRVKNIYYYFTILKRLLEI
jgi:hypothetical protein